jgi:hypothetical protein
MDRDKFWEYCRKLLEAYRSKQLGDCRMPEDSNPGFGKNETELRLNYFTLPMSLNYQRDSYRLWEAALRTYRDQKTKTVFDLEKVAEMDEVELKQKLKRYGLALLPNKHTQTWKKISETVYYNWGSLGKMLERADNDLERVKWWMQEKYKKGFPYLSGPKIFNYWSFIVGTYGGVKWKHEELIEIAPDTHVTKGSVILGVISSEEAERLSKEEISKRWRNALEGSGIKPIEMHPPLWFWSRSGFKYKLS